MKSKISKIMGIGLTLVLLVSMMVFALPVSADPYPPLAPAVPNTWTGFPPTPGAPGGWFYDPDIAGVGPVAQSPVDGDLYASVQTGLPTVATLGEGGGGTAEWACDIWHSAPYSAYLSVPDATDGNQWADVDYFPVNIALGDIDLDTTSYWCYSTAGTYMPYLMFEITGGVRINDDAPLSTGFTAGWEEYVVSTGVDVWQNDGGYTGAAGPAGWATWAETVAHFGADTLVTGILIENSEITANGAWPLSAYIDDVCISGTCYGFDPATMFMKSTDGGRTWAASPPGAYFGGAVVDMVCSDLFEDVIYVTDGNYVYKSVDGGMSFAYVAQDDLEKNLMGDCGIPITCGPITSIDVGYDGSEKPVVFIGTKQITNRIYATPHPSASDFVVGSVYWIADESFPAQWYDLELKCYGCCAPEAGGFQTGCYDVYAVGCAPDFATSSKVYAVITTDDDDCDGGTTVPSTRVVYTTGTVCSWFDVSELGWDCVNDADHSFEIIHASRIAFPSYYGTNPTLFVGVDGDGDGGDVYRVSDTVPATPLALDLNVGGFTTGCIGTAHADICSLDILNDALIAGANNGTNVYYSADGGWTWTASLKDPTGGALTYALFVGDSVLAATSCCDCAVSLDCGAAPAQFFNQISLISMEIDQVLDLSHAPGYLDGSSTMYALTFDADACNTDDNTSLLRWDGTYWERVFSTTAEMDWVEVSPDFNDTGCVYLANTGFDMFRSLDAGCSWAPLTFPCDPQPTISAWIVVDLETVLAAGANPDDGTIYRTTYHGAQPWDAFPVAGAGNGIDFDLSPNIANDSSVLFGDATGKVFLSKDLGATWTTWVGTPLAVANTYVVFDPGYGTAGDPGEHIIYAAKGTVITRCDVSAVEAGMGTIEFVQIGSVGEASGIAAAGDTALYVADADVVLALNAAGGVLRTLNPMAVPATLVFFERLTVGLEVNTSTLAHPQASDDLWLTAGSNMLWAIDNSGQVSPTDTIWMWDDVLATPVIQVAPTDGTALVTPTTATLTWEALDAATLYEISLYRYCPQCPDEMLPVYDPVTDENYTSADTCLIVTGLDSGTKYYWSVRVAQGYPFLSKWSDLREFDTALGSVLVLCSPICGASDIILTTNFSWDAVPGAAAYELQVVAASADGTADFTGAATYTSDVNALASIPGLEYSTVYYWQVRAIKDGVAGAWAVCLFTTEAVPEEPVAVEPITPVDVIIEEITPLWIWVIIGIGAVLVIVVIVLIVSTRRVP